MYGFTNDRVKIWARAAVWLVLLSYTALFAVNAYLPFSGDLSMFYQVEMPKDLDKETDKDKDAKKKKVDKNDDDQRARSLGLNLIDYLTNYNHHLAPADDPHLEAFTPPPEHVSSTIS